MGSQSASRLLLFQLIVAVTFRVANAAGSMDCPEAKGVLLGSVSRGPLTPHEEAGALRGHPVEGVRIDVATVDNKHVTTLVSDSSGNFKASLPPGKYRVTMEAVDGARPRNMPAMVSISAGKETRLNIFLDTGLR